MTSAPAASTTSSNPSLLLTLTVGLIGLLAFIQVYSVQSIVPLLQHDLNASVVEIGNAVGMTVLAVALVSPFIGMISDALGRKWIIVLSVFALSIPTALMAQIDTVYGLQALRFAQGLAVPGVTVVAVAYIGEELRGAAMIRLVTLYISGCVLGGFLGRFFMGHLTEFISWRAAFLVMALLNLAGAFVVWRGLPASRHFVANRRLSSSLQTLAQLLRNRSLQTACALGFTVLFALLGSFTFINFHLADSPYYFSPGALANIFLVYLLGVVMTPLAGRIIPKIGARRTVLIAVSISMTGLLLTLAQPIWTIIVGVALAACGAFITQSATMSFIAHRVTTGRSQASGLYYSIYYCGGFTGAWLCGLAYTWAHWPGTVALLVLVQALGWIIAWRFMPGPLPGGMGNPPSAQ